MMLAFQVLALAIGQPAAEQPQFRECPSGVYARHDRDCPSSGPHPTYLYFEQDEADLTDRARTHLDLIGVNFQRSGALGAANIAILIESHTDRAGAADDNLALTRRRAEMVRDYLIGRGVPANVIGITYFGEQRAAATTADGVAEPDHRVTVVWTVAPETFVRSRTRASTGAPDTARRRQKATGAKVV